MIKNSVIKSKGAVRLRTDDFKSFRSQSKQSPHPIEFAQREVKQNKSSHINFNEQRHDALPPEWVDVYEKINEDFEQLEQKSNKKLVKNLSEVQLEKQKRVFGEHSARNKKIENLLEENSKIVSDIEGHIKSFTKNEGNEEDRKIRKNIQSKLARNLKDFTSKLKNSEELYLSSLQKTGDSSSGLFDLGKQEEMKIENFKNEEIQKLAENFSQIAEIFKELNELIVDQGTILDRIDYSLVHGKENTGKANEELIKAEKHQKCGRASTCLLSLVVMIVVLLLALIFKVT